MRPRSAAALLAVGLAACGGSSPAPTRASLPDPTERRVEAVVFLNIDAPEKSGDTQEPWAVEATSSLQSLIPTGSSVRLETGPTILDTYGRLLAHVRRTADGLDANEEQLRRGRAVLYVIWPNVAHFEEYRAAQVAAQRDGLGIWQPGHRLAELPFEYRRRKGGEPLSRPVGDWFTRSYVPAADVAAVPVNNRVFFSSTREAESAGFLPCPRDASGYAASCFGPAA